MGKGQPFVDKFIEHAIDVERYKTYESARLTQKFNATNRQIKALVQGAKGIETKAKYAHISKQVSELTGKLSDDLWTHFSSHAVSFVDAEKRFVVDNIAKHFSYAVGETPTAGKIFSNAAFASYNGTDTYESYFQGLGDRVFQTWDSALRNAYTTEAPAKDIIKQVLGTSQEPGTMNSLSNSLQTNTESMIGNLMDSTRHEVIDLDESIYAGFMWVAALDTRTCIVCANYDGKIFKAIEEIPDIPAHANCRCFTVPVISGAEEDYQNINYSDWLSRQSEEKQREILGASRYTLYKNGMTVDRFVRDSRLLNLDELVKKENLDVLGAAIYEKSERVREVYSDKYYDSIRNRKNPTDIAKISAASGFTEKQVKEIRGHLFVNTHNLDGERIGRFDSDWMIAQAWQRMEQNWTKPGMDIYRDLDILLLKHERMELTIMQAEGINAALAHDRANEKYPWNIEINKFIKRLME